MFVTINILSLILRRLSRAQRFVESNKRKSYCGKDKNKEIDNKETKYLTASYYFSFIILNFLLVVNKERLKNKKKYK